MDSHRYIVGESGVVQGREYVKQYHLSQIRKQGDLPWFQVRVRLPHDKLWQALQGDERELRERDEVSRTWVLCRQLLECKRIAV